LKSEISLILTDGRLPGASGLWLAEKIRGISEVPIVLISGEVERYQTMPGFECFTHAFSKPISRQMVCRILDEYKTPGIHLKILGK
jgi:CheY-like chemotaxis protein